MFIGRSTTVPVCIVLTSFPVITPLLESELELLSGLDNIKSERPPATQITRVVYDS